MALHVANKNITCTLPPNFRFLFFILLNDSKGKILLAPNVTFNKTDSRFALWRTVVLVLFPFFYLSSQASGFGPLPPLLCTAPKLAASSLAEADVGQLYLLHRVSQQCGNLCKEFLEESMTNMVSI